MILNEIKPRGDGRRGSAQSFPTFPSILLLLLLLGSSAVGVVRGALQLFLHWQASGSPSSAVEGAAAVGEGAAAAGWWLWLAPATSL